MTRTTNARIAGFTYLFYIAAGLTSMAVSGRASSGAGIAERLANIGQHTTAMGVVTLFGLLQSFSALVLAVTTYALTRAEDPDLAMLGLTCRVGEGIVGISLPTSLGLVWLATVSGTDAPDAGAAHALGAFLREVGGWTSLISATFFAVGSTLFSFLFLRGRLIPISLAWLGVIASLLLVVLLPAQLAGFLKGPVTLYMWLPMLVFEVALALWLLIKGVAAPAPR